MEEKDFTRPIFYILLFLAVIVVGALCKVLSSVVIPIVLAIFLALTFIPVVQKINKKFKIPWVLTVLLIDILLLASIAAISTLLFNSLSTITSEYPKYENRFMSIYQIVAQNLNIEIDDSKSLFQTSIESLEIICLKIKSLSLINKFFFIK